MTSESHSTPIIAYETQARYAAGEAWITLDVAVSLRIAIDDAFFWRDPWGRAPTEVRVVSVMAGSTHS